MLMFVRNPDLDALEDSDMTEIGAKGVSHIVFCCHPVI